MRELSTRESRLRFLFRRFKGFMKILVHSKRGVLGIGIIVVFSLIALSASIITPFSPVDIPTHPSNSPPAARYAKPIWYGYLFPTESLTANVEAIDNGNFETASSIDQFRFTTDSISGYVSNPQFVSNAGFRKDGCIAITFAREADRLPERVNASLKKVFDYPYAVPPSQFIGFAAIRATTSENLSVTVSVVIEEDNGEKRLNWWTAELGDDQVPWLTPSPPIDSYAEKTWLKEKFGPAWVVDPARTMFNESTKYRYGVEIAFNDTRAGEEAEATVYIDDLMLRLLGNTSGMLGTDQYGRDIFTQLIYGARISLVVGLLAAFLSTSIGLVIGLVAGYVGKFVDQILMRFTDMLLVIPDVPLFIVLMAVLSPSVWNLIILITMLGWTGFARIVRSQVLSLRERPFVEAAKSIGSGKAHIIFRHILPNVMSLVYVSLAMAVPSAIVLEAWLSWLGLYDPTVMTWGRMLHDAQNEPLGIRMWWWIVPPGLAIALISLSFVLLGYALDEILNPKLRERR